MAASRLAARGLVVLVLLAVASAAHAHEFWIEPESHRPAKGAVVRFTLRVGDGFPGEAYPRTASHIERFERFAPSKVHPVIGREGTSPAGVARLREPGVHVVAYRSTRSAIVLRPMKFEAYLAEEGLEHVIAARAKAGTSLHPGREVFSRCAKTLVKVGDAASTGFDRTVDLPLELVPVDDPFRAKPGDTLAFTLYLRGKPLEGCRVKAFRAGDGEAVTHSKTGEDGRVRLRLGKPGRWMIAAVHMEPAPEGLNADWQSLWSSLTFDVATPPVRER